MACFREYENRNHIELHGFEMPAGLLLENCMYNLWARECFGYPF